MLSHLVNSHFQNATQQFMAGKLDGEIASEAGRVFNQNHTNSVSLHPLQ